MSNLLVKSSFSVRSRNVRIGPVSLFALIIIVCMATLAVLTVATAHSSLVLSQRQAAATHELYVAETGGQTFLTNLNDMLKTQGVAPQGGDVLTEKQLKVLCDSALNATGDEVETTAYADANNVYAELSSKDGRTLKITVAILPNGTYRVDRWMMTSVENEEQSFGSLYTGY